MDEITMYIVDISGENGETAKIPWKDIATELAKLWKLPNPVTKRKLPTE